MYQQLIFIEGSAFSSQILFCCFVLSIGDWTQGYIPRPFVCEQILLNHPRCAQTGNYLHAPLPLAPLSCSVCRQLKKQHRNPVLMSNTSDRQSGGKTTTYILKPTNTTEHPNFNVNETINPCPQQKQYSHCVNNGWTMALKTTNLNPWKLSVLELYWKKMSFQVRNLETRR